MCGMAVVLPVSPESAVSQMQSSLPGTFVAISVGGNGLSRVMGNKGQLGQLGGAYHHDSKWF